MPLLKREAEEKEFFIIKNKVKDIADGKRRH